VGPRAVLDAVAKRKIPSPRQSYHGAIILCVASQRVFVYFVIDSVRKHLDTPSYVVILSYLLTYPQVQNNLSRDPVTGAEFIFGLQVL
jgi:hypothetical protein